MLGFRPTAKSVVDEGGDNAKQTRTIFSQFSANAASLTTLMPDGTPWWNLPRKEAKKYKDQNNALFLEAMAACTAITYVDGVLVGDPLDLSMFKITGWILDESVANGDFTDQMVIANVYPPDSGSQTRIEEVPFDSSGSSS